jgi:hypothetical protein
LANRPPDRDGLDIGDRPDDLEVQLVSSIHRSRRTPMTTRGRRPSGEPVVGRVLRRRQLGNPQLLPALFGMPEIVLRLLV